MSSRLDAQRQARWTNPDTGRIVNHPYERSVHSGAGNCWCGRAEADRLHPHEFTPAARDPRFCVCGRLEVDHRG